MQQNRIVLALALNVALTMVALWVLLNEPRWNPLNFATTLLFVVVGFPVLNGALVVLGVLGRPSSRGDARGNGGARG